MTSSKTRVAVALLASTFAWSISAAWAQRAQGQSVAEIRAECFRQANAAADMLLTASPGATAERNSRGTAAYRDCARRKGIRP
jgi:hypothetical protein